MAALRIHQHGIVLAGPFARALAGAAVGAVLLRLGPPASLAGAIALAVSALAAVRAAWRWERTQLIVTPEELRLVRGTLRRRSSVVRRASLGAVEIEQTLPGRLLGYGTVLAGGLEVAYVARPRDLARMLV